MNPLSSNNKTDSLILQFTPNKQEKEIDLTDKSKKILYWTQNLNFRSGEADEHFNKHKNEYRIKKLSIDSTEKYVETARKIIFESIFEEGFVIRLGRGNRVAFFTGKPTGIPEYIVSVSSLPGLGAKISTFYPANGKTPFLTVKNFQKGIYSKEESPEDSSTPFIARFKKGKSEGWKAIKTNDYFMEIPGERNPIKALNNDINFLGM